MQPGDRQHTLKRSITCEGVGLHSGAPVTMTLHPAAANSGIMFRRTDIHAASAYVPALFDRVADTRLGTTLVNEQGTSVSTIEHLMAALWGCGIDNILIELDGPEVPIMDGSSEPFVFLIETAGLRKLSAARRFVRVLRPVTVRSGDATVTLLPHDGFALDVEIDFAHKSISQQRGVYDFARMTFKNMLSRARTFGFAHEVEHLRSIGLARGGSLANAIVIGEEGVLNQEGLRYGDEFVRHKALDCIGDLFLAGAPLLARVVGTRPGHGINNLALRALFADSKAWQLTETAHVSTRRSSAARAAGSVNVGVAIPAAPCK